MLKLTDPRSHTLEEIKPLLIEFLSNHPEEAIAIRNRMHWYLVNPGCFYDGEYIDSVFTDVSIKLRSFLKEKIEYDNNSALTYAFRDLLSLIESELSENLADKDK